MTLIMFVYINTCNIYILLIIVILVLIFLQVITFYIKKKKEEEDISCKVNQLQKRKNYLHLKRYILQAMVKK